MTLTAAPEPAIVSPRSSTFGSRRSLAVLCGLWLVLFFASLFSPPVLDDADGTHANAARQMLLSGDGVTMRVNDVRYMEKAPLPYWIAAVSFRVFGLNAFAAHLPQALAVLLLMLLGYRWAREAFGERAALYTGLGVLTSAGVFLFTRVLLPDPLLSLLLAAGLYCFLRALETRRPEYEAAERRVPGAKAHVDPEPVMPGLKSRPISETMFSAAFYAYAMWAALALAVLTKGLVALVFLFGAAALYLALTGEAREWRRLRPLSGGLLMLAIAAPWHILAGLRNTGGMDGHGFFWFYFVNEHVLRFLGRRIPRDYNKLPGLLYWSLNLVWLFPWALFAPLPAILGWRAVRASAVRLKELTVSGRTVLLLTVFSAVVLLFFSVSTNQEYYTFPAYLPLLMLMAGALARAEAMYSGVGAEATSSRRWITFAHAAFAFVGVAVSAALAYGLWTSRHIDHAPDIGDLLAHRGVGDYTLSMSSLFDLTGPSFAALRLPAALALAAFAIGPAVAWMLRVQRRHLSATSAVALTSAAFLIAAHIALVRFAPMLSSEDMAAKIQELEDAGAISRENTLLLYGDQAYGSSIPFYLNRPLDRPALLVDGRSSSMLFGSTFPDAQGLFLTPAQLLAQWGTGERKLLFVPPDRRDEADRLLGARQIVLAETSGKALVTDRPLDQAGAKGAARTP
jgi:4-amino-4-deoxy-L-arabinose transferase-like glycosyltransferase